MSEELKGTNVYSPVVPGTSDDKYPTHYSLYGKGGYKAVNTIAERDAIPEDRLEPSCVVFVAGEGEKGTDYRYMGEGKWEEKDNFLPTGETSDGAAIKTFDDLISYILINGGSATGGVQRNLRIINNLDSKNIAASKGEPCILNFTFISQERYNPGDPYENTGERGFCQISVRNGGNSEYVVVKQVYINSGSPFSIDITEFLASGANNVMIKIMGEVTEVTAPAFVYTVQLTSLSISANNFKWWTAYTGDITFPLNIGGNISKTLYITVTGDEYNESYQVPIGTGVYTETAYNHSIPHPGKTGVFNIAAYVANSDGTIKTRTVSFNIICAVSGEQAKLIALNNVLEKATNWSENMLFDYTIYDGDNVHTSARFIILKDGESVFASNEDSISCSDKHTFSFPMEIETMDNSEFEIVAHVKEEETELTAPVTYRVDNSSGYSAVAGATFYLSPKTRSNNQANRQKVVNEIDGSEVATTWDGVNWGNDCWTIDSDGNKVLRLMAGSLMTIDRRLFSLECARRGKTIEIDYRVDNVTDYTQPIITISSPSGDSFVGLNIYADDIIMHTQSLKNDKVQSLHTFEGKRTRFALTILPDAYGNPGFNLCILYINGRKNREFTYESNDYFAHNGQLVIGSDYGDVDIYGIREYDSGLTSQGVLTNYINWLSGTEEKARVKAFNDILDSNGSEIDIDNTKDQFNVFVFDNTIPSMADQSQRVGKLDVFFYEHPEWNVSINNVTAKGQGTSSMKYWIWNTRYQLDKKKSVITYADGTSSAAGAKWAMTPGLPAGRKFTAKKNYASSMHSHKIGSVNSYTDLIREVGILNEAMNADEKVRVSVWQAPFVCFEKQINDEGENVYIFRGLYTFGPDKGDADTFGYDTDLYPHMMSIEGSDNSPLLTLFRVPWNPDSNLIAYNEDEEAWQYNGANSFDYGEGNLESISKFIPAYNLVYQCSPRLKAFDGTLDELNTQMADFKNEPYEYWISKEGDANRFNVYYFEASEGQFMPSDIGEGAINLISQLVDKGYGLASADIEGKSGSELNTLFINARIAKFRAEAPLYWDIDDCLFFMNNVEFNAGTDERAKNTYPYTFGTETSKWRWRVDDADTRFDTTNRGLPDKEYSVETHDVDETGASVWNGETNNFFNLMELAFPEEKVASMRKSMAAMQALGNLKSGNDLEKIYAFYQKYFFSQAQEYFPSNAYNADAKFCYENGKLAYNEGRYSNDTDPITQSLGDHYLAEQRWITKRILYMMSKYSFGLFSANGTDTITVRAAGNTIKYELTPAMDNYPLLTKVGVGIGLCKDVITDFFVVNCPNLSPMQLLVDIMNAQAEQGKDHKLKRIRAVGFEETYDDSDMLEKLAALSDGTYQGLSTEGLAGEDEYPVLDGTLNIDATHYADSVEALRTAFTKLILNVTGKEYVRLKDSIVRNVIIVEYGDGEGITMNQIQGISFLSRSYFKDNANLASFNEFVYFTAVSEIDSFMFDNCINFESIRFPESLRIIGVSAFRNSAIRSIHITSNVERIYAGAFEKCKWLQTVTFGTNKLYDLQNSVFRETGIKNILLPDTITQMVGGHVFYGCKFLETVHYPVNEYITEIPKNQFCECTSLKEINISQYITSIGQACFRLCKSLKKIEITDNIKSLGSGVFYQCESLESFTIPSSMTSIPDELVRRCYSLKHLEIPENILSMGNYSVAECTNLEYVMMRPVVPPAIVNLTFLNTPCSFYVPDDSLEAYKVANIWSQYANRIYPISKKTID